MGVNFFLCARVLHFFLSFILKGLFFVKLKINWSICCLFFLLGKDGQ